VADSEKYFTCQPHFFAVGKIRENVAKVMKDNIQADREKNPDDSG
jgi:hypothetical protein